jgi:hypothetical protein
MRHDGTLVAHCGAQVVSRRELALIDAPEPQGPKHVPVRHSALIEAVEAQMSERGMRIARQQHAVQRGGLRYFGVLDVDWTQGSDLLDDTRGFAIGIRHANDQSMAAQVAVGTRIFVCDNMVFGGGEIAAYRKHTNRFDLGDDMSKALDAWCEQQSELTHAIEAQRSVSLTDDEARVRICNVFEQGALPARLFPQAARNYLSPDDSWADCTPRNLWGVHNAMTRAARDMKPGPRYRATLALSALFTQDPALN